MSGLHHFKGQVGSWIILNFNFFVEIKKTDSLRSGDLNVAWKLAGLKENLCRGSTEHTVKNLFDKIHRKRPVPESLLKHPATLLERRLWHKCFLLNYKFLFKITFFTECLCLGSLKQEKLLRKYICKTYHLNADVQTAKKQLRRNLFK